MPEKVPEDQCPTDVRCLSQRRINGRPDFFGRPVPENAQARGGINGRPDRPDVPTQGNRELFTDVRTVPDDRRTKLFCKNLDDDKGGDDDDNDELV